MSPTPCTRAPGYCPSWLSTLALGVALWWAPGLARAEGGGASGWCSMCCSCLLCWNSCCGPGLIVNLCTSRPTARVYRGDKEVDGDKDRDGRRRPRRPEDEEAEEKPPAPAPPEPAPEEPPPPQVIPSQHRVVPVTLTPTLERRRPRVSPAPYRY